MAEQTPSKRDLDGRVCVVTGGGGGIGRAIVQVLTAEGARVAILDRNEAAARETLDLMSRAGGDGLAVACDVSSRDSIESACATVKDRFGDADILVNNAAIRRPGPLRSLSLEDWNAGLSVNLTGYFLCSQVFGRAMLEKGSGVLVHVSSIGAEFAQPMTGSYCVGKAGIVMLSRQLAIEWGPLGVRSNAVFPGFVFTGQAFYSQPGLTERRSSSVPSRRVGLPEEMAQAVLFLASARSSYVNGTEVRVDGGFAANLMNLIPGPANAVLNKTEAS
jgi:NAD(P)-dependent dehydrogenase (short-subunit alcohol dehydrogenase family)